jgi:hypothetical protein
MQIDFHHATTYVTARLAGFAHEQADIIAYAAQYVDDATSGGTVVFDNGAMYSRISSAHKTTDPENLRNTENLQVWLPFHFLPGNDGLKPGEDPKGKFIEKIICRPGVVSYVAKDMLKAAFDGPARPDALHRLGVTMHTYADTWAHQGFAGVLHPVNEVEDIEDMGHSGQFPPDWINDLLEDMVPPLGHARAQVFPDMPFLTWRYRNGRRERISRCNTDVFCEAANEMCMAMQRYLQKSDNGIPAADQEVTRTLFTSLNFEDENKRHKGWLDAIAAGSFSFGPATISYADCGYQSWKAEAMGSSSDLPVHPYRPEFLQSNWKRFHDALQQHRLTLLHDVLPSYGICAG